MPKKKQSDSPYVGRTLQDVENLEKDAFVIQVGADVFMDQGFWAFDAENTEFYYGQILNGLNEMKEKGTENEKEDAIKCLLLLKSFPLRLQ